MDLRSTKILGARRTTPQWAEWIMNLTPYHQPVMLKETLQYLRVVPGGRYIDCTVGEGGHTQGILQNCMPGGHALAIDADPDAIDFAKRRLDPYLTHVTLIQGNSVDLNEITKISNFGKADGILMDLGLSSRQIEGSGRGFSFQGREKLDMRFDPSGPITAHQIINSYPQEDLSQLIRSYGEEPRARTIARAIVQKRPVQSTEELTNLVVSVLGRNRRGSHPATLTFQALRIAVNDELTNLRKMLDEAVQLLKPGGRLVVISYHSLEDRIVKTTLRREASNCICPSEIPRCACSHQPRFKIITKRVIRPSSLEIHQNRRSRSARMRVAERIKEDTKEQF